jgi:hypothetical protein
VPIPRRAHDASGEVELDVVDAVLDLLPDGAHEAVRPVAFPRVAGGEEVAARGGKKVPAGEEPGTDVLARVEGTLPRHVHEMRGARASEPDHPTLRQGLHHAVAEDRRLLRDRRAGGREVVRVDVDVPQPREQIGPGQIDDLGLAGVGRPARVEHFHDAALLDGDAGPRHRPRVDAVEHRGIGQDALHETALRAADFTPAAYTDREAPHLGTCAPRAGTSWCRA